MIKKILILVSCGWLCVSFVIALAVIFLGVWVSTEHIIPYLAQFL